MGMALLYLMPSLMLAALLLLRRYPGERLLVAAAEARRAARPRRTLLTLSRARPRARVPRGGLLIASALAVRPPPGFLVPA